MFTKRFWIITNGGAKGLEDVSFSQHCHVGSYSLPYIILIVAQNMYLDT
jgi:hypothetical protein